MKRRHKYGAVPTAVDGITFPSKAEARRYGELTMLEKGGLISSLVLQPKYRLSVHAGAGQFVEIGEYRADFEYWDKRTKQRVVEDVKSPATRTAVYRLKKRHVEAQYGIKIVEVMS